MAAPVRLEQNDLASLVILARCGSPDAFGELYTAHTSLVRAVLRAHASEDDVPDLAHETFLIALKRIRDVREPAAFPGWLASIARNVAHAHRRATRDAEELRDDLAAEPVDVDTAIECERVLDAVDALPEKIRRPLVMRLIHDMTGEEIARALGMSHGAVRVTLHRGLKLVRQRLDIVVAACAAIVLIGSLSIYGRALKPWSVVMMPANGSTIIPQSKRVHLGEWIVTDSVSTARLNVGVIGRADIKPGSRVRVVSGSATDYRLALERGELRARIWAPPRFFSVETKNAIAVDLGCIYTLRVARDGATILKVEKGEVELRGANRLLRVNAGDSATIRSDGTSGQWSTKMIPFYERWWESLRALRGSNPQPSDPKSDALSN